MREPFTVYPIGRVRHRGERSYLQILGAQKPALLGLEGFTHLEVLWWCSHCDTPEHRTLQQFDPPFPAPRLGVLASRAPMRPNPIATSVVPIVALDAGEGHIEIAAIDAYDDTPILDIKPYLPMYSRVKRPGTPQWAARWPQWLPEGGIAADHNAGE